MNNLSALILYGSETGNAFDFAQEVGRMTERIHFWTNVTSLDAIGLVRIWGPIHYYRCFVDNQTVFSLGILDCDYCDLDYWPGRSSNQCS